MTQKEWDELYLSLYRVYEYSSLRDEYVRSSLGDALDHMIKLKEQKLVYPN